MNKFFAFENVETNSCFVLECKKSARPLIYACVNDNVIVYFNSMKHASEVKSRFFHLSPVLSVASRGDGSIDDRGEVHQDRRRSHR